DRYPLAINDGAATRRVAAAFREFFTDERVHAVGPGSAGEVFGAFGADWGVSSVFWFVGSTDPKVHAKAKSENRLNELPTNHNPRFLPVIHPTLETGVQTLVVASCAWFAQGK